MEIQTFEIEEAVGGTTPEIEAEALQLIETLGLKGQKTLITPKPEGGERFQYPEMTKLELAVYGEVFPQKTVIEEYAAGIIPIRVMQVAAHAKGFCDAVQVWHKKMRDPDPILVGTKGANEYAATFKRFILARWGDALKDFSELVKEARVLYRERFERELKEKASNAQSKLGQLDSLVETAMQGEHVFLSV